MSKVVGKVGEAIRLYYGQTQETYRAYAAGFAAGQAEKVYLGVCKAAMFRPSKEHFDWYANEVFRIAENYGLRSITMSTDSPETPYEIWIYEKGFKILAWVHHPINSAEWHQLRAEACGIPADKVDLNYHMRSGYGERCD